MFELLFGPITILIALGLIGLLVRKLIRDALDGKVAPFDESDDDDADSET